MGRSVPAIINDIGFGVSQLRTSCIVNGAWLADGAEALAISAVATELVKYFHITEVESGTLTSIVYLGTLIGTVFSGFLGDILGRRLPILLSYPVIIAFSLLSANVTTFQILIAVRLFVGLGFGLGQPNAITLLVEVTPPKWRIFNQGLAQVFFALGELFCCAIIWLHDPSMQSVDWRALLVWGAVPAAAFLLLSLASLPESPEFLALSKPDEAKASLEAMALQNGKEVAIDLDCQGEGWSSFDSRASPQKPVLEQVSIVFGSNLILNTIAVAWICFCYNLIVYGCFFAFPQVLPKLNVGMSAVGFLASGALFEIPCDAIGVFLGTRLPRRQQLMVFLIGLCVAAGVFMVGMKTTNPTCLLIGYFGLKGFPQIGSLALYVFAAELYPVEARSTGVSMVTGLGRIGAILASVVYGAIIEMYGQPQQFFQLSMLLIFSCMGAVAFLPETRPWASEADESETEHLVSAGKA